MNNRHSKKIIPFLTLFMLVACTLPSNSSEDLNSGSEASNPSNEESSIPVSSEGNDPASSETPTEGDFIDEVFNASFAYNEASYNIKESVPTTNPYSDIQTTSDKYDFYAYNYNRATSYADAMYRTEAGLVSGDIKDTTMFTDYPLNHLPNRTYKNLSGYRVNEGVYEYFSDGSFKSYAINTLHGKTKKIYYGAAYVSLDDVAAYLFAFGRGPANYQTAKTGNALSKAINEWGEYGRVNDAYYNSDVTHYLYEPSLPHTDNGGPIGEDMYHYHELDFGYTKTPWGYGLESYQPYNNGENINRGTVRFVYSAKNQAGEWGAEYIPVEHRHVFLTFNHYNDFAEYLNYEGGWGQTFGWMSAGNDYVAGMSASQYGPGYYDFIDPFPQTLYPNPQIKTLSELRALNR